MLFLLKIFFCKGFLQSDNLLLFTFRRSSVVPRTRHGFTLRLTDLSQVGL
jgi:hypothetical protein